MPDNVLVVTLTGNAFAKVALGQIGERPGPAQRFACYDEAQFFAGIDAFLHRHGRPSLIGAAVSAAGFERDGRIDLPAYGFAVQREALRTNLGLRRVNLVNDVVARVLAIPYLTQTEVELMTEAVADTDRPKAIIGAYTGLGVAALAPDGMGDWVALPTEGGHADLAATDAFEIRVLEELRRTHGRVDRETAVSVPGLVHVWRAVCALGGTACPDLAPADIVERARAGDPSARGAIDLCVGWLAAIASDTALNFGARGGVYLIGLLIDILGDCFDWSLFAARFTAKGRLSGYVAEVPVFRILAQDIDLIGLATLFN